MALKQLKFREFTSKRALCRRRAYYLVIIGRYAAGKNRKGHRLQRKRNLVLQAAARLQRVWYAPKAVRVPCSVTQTRDGIHQTPASHGFKTTLVIVISGTLL